MGTNEKKQSETESIRRLSIATCTTLAFVVGGISILWLTKRYAITVGDAALVALLLLPVLIFLAMTGKLKEISFPGGTSAKFVEDQVDRVADQITEVSGYEPERSTYFGKLKQVLDKEKGEVCLIYADVDGLRGISRKIYGDQRNQQVPNPSADGQQDPTQQDRAHALPSTDRRPESDIRRKVIVQLMFALTDAFYDMNIEPAKVDVFILEEPDVVMITRSVSRPKAKSIAEEGLRIFNERHGYRATAAIVSSSEKKKERVTPQNLHEEAVKRLDYAKRERKGQVCD